MNIRINPTLLLFELDDLFCNPMTWVMITGCNILFYEAARISALSWLGLVNGTSNMWDMRQHAFWNAYMFFGGIIFCLGMIVVSTLYLLNKPKLSKVTEALLTSPLSVEELLHTSVLACAIFNTANLFLHLLIITPFLNAALVRYRGLSNLCIYGHQLYSSPICLAWNNHRLVTYYIDLQTVLALICGIGVSCAILCVVARIVLQTGQGGLRLNGYLMIMALALFFCLGSSPVIRLFMSAGASLASLSVLIPSVIVVIWMLRPVDRERMVLS